MSSPEPGGPIQVSAWNGWDRLRRILVGRPDGTMVQAAEPAVSRHWPEHGYPRGIYGAIPDDVVQRAAEQVESFVQILTRRGIQIDRPHPADFAACVSTPEWTQLSMWGCMTPRDVLITVGNEILESTMCYRSRWFEYICYRPVIEAYYRADPNLRWEAAPKPRLTAASYRPGFWDEFEGLSFTEQIRRVRANDLLLTEEEPLFDAADIARFGKDLFVQLSLVTNRSGCRWIRQHFPDHRVHAVMFGNNHPLHIDCTWVPLRPGLVLHCSERAAEDDLLAYFALNDWEVVSAAPPMRERGDVPPLCFCSQWLSLNILSLDEGTVCVEASEVRQAEQLDRLGFEVIPVPFWDVAPFGGGIHCATVDIHREGTMADYFPRRYGRF